MLRQQIALWFKLLYCNLNWNRLNNECTQWRTGNPAWRCRLLFSNRYFKYSIYSLWGSTRGSSRIFQVGAKSENYLCCHKESWIKPSPCCLFGAITLAQLLTIDIQFGGMDVTILNGLLRPILTVYFSMKNWETGDINCNI